MASRWLPRPQDSQVDPFNAGEPELPGGEPEPLLEPEELGEQVEYAAHGDPTGTPHKPGDNYQAPTTRGHSYDAPTIDEPHQKPSRRARTSRSSSSSQETGKVQQRTERDRRIVTRVIVILIILVSFGTSIVSCAASLVGRAVEGAGEVVGDLGDALFDNGSEGWDNAEVEDYLPEQSDDDLAAAGALEERLDALLASTESGPLHERIAAYFEGKCLEVDGYSASELGIDAGALASLVLAGASSEAGYAYVYDDGTASAYANIASLDSSALFWEIHDTYGEYLLENALWGRDNTMPTEEQRAHVAALVDEVLATYDETHSYTYAFELELVDGTWVVDEGDLDDSLEMIFGLY